MSVGAYVRSVTTCCFKSPTTGLVGTTKSVVIAFVRVTNIRQQATAACPLGQAVSKTKIR